jgi:hypothetical protein
MVIVVFFATMVVLTMSFQLIESPMWLSHTLKQDAIVLRLLT